jgi:aspartate racemase
MKTIGLIGGMSWESSVTYYQIINRKVKERLGGVHSARSLMFSVEFAEIARLQNGGEWEKLTEIMIDAAQRLERGGADFIVICTNTMHKLADEMAAEINIPILHIADAVAEEIKKKSFKTIGLLGTRFTMEGDFLKQKFADEHGIETLIPPAEGRETIHSVIYDELVKGIFTADSKKKFLQIIGELTANGAEGIVLGCTEIPLLITGGDTDAILFDTAAIHAEKAVEYSLG